MKYDVHLYAVVRVKVPNIEATSQADAMGRAVERVNLHALFPLRVNPMPGVECVEYAEEIDGCLVEYAEEIDGCLVDEANDPNHRRSRFYDRLPNRDVTVRRRVARRVGRRPVSGILSGEKNLTRREPVGCGRGGGAVTDTGLAGDLADTDMQQEPGGPYLEAPAE